MKVTVKLLTRFVSPLLHVPDTYIDVSSMSAMAQSCNTDQNYTFLEAWTRPFFFFVIRVQHDISKGNVLITRILFHKQIEQRRCSPKSGSRSLFPCPCSCLSHPAAKIINTFYTTQVHVARNTSMKRKKSVDFKSRSWSSRGYDHSLSYVLT